MHQLAATSFCGGNQWGALGLCVRARRKAPAEFEPGRLGGHVPVAHAQLIAIRVTV